jgi:hypothetical protein
MTKSPFREAIIPDERIDSAAGAVARRAIVREFGVSFDPALRVGSG